jgi:uncharacterized protein (TIGR03032 family)
MMVTRPDADAAIRCEVAGAFADWLRDSGGALAITTYQAGKVAIVSWDRDVAPGRLSLLLREFPKPMGLAVSGRRMALATRNAVFQLANAPLLAPDYLESGPHYDALWLPRVAHFTGDLNVHDLAYGRDDLWLVNTRFSCLSLLSEEFSFQPRWRPKFVSQTAPEDRCHLNGLAIVDGRPKYVTALGESDTPGGWRENKASGGVLIDIESNEIVLRGLAMPHSPRWHDGQLFVLNSGTGELWRLDATNGTHDIVCALPGYLRGLCFVGPFALVGLCQIRERHIFGGLPVQNNSQSLKCGVAVVDTRSGQMIGLFEFTAGVEEIYEVQFLPGTSRPMILNLDKEATRQAFTAPEFSYWLRPSNLVADYSQLPPSNSGGPQ